MLIITGCNITKRNITWIVRAQISGEFGRGPTQRGQHRLWKFEESLKVFSVTRIQMAPSKIESSTTHTTILVETNSRPVSPVASDLCTSIRGFPANFANWKYERCTQWRHDEFFLCPLPSQFRGWFFYVRFGCWRVLIAEK